MSTFDSSHSTGGEGTVSSHARAFMLADSAVNAAHAVAPHAASIHMIRVAGSGTNPNSANLRQAAITNLRHHLHG